MEKKTIDVKTLKAKIENIKKGNNPVALRIARMLEKKLNSTKVGE